MRPSSESDAGRRLLRFDRVERAAHWATAGLVVALVATGTILYVPSLSVAVGRRLLIEDIHVYCGVAVFVPLAFAVAGPWGRAIRRDLAGMGRISRAELTWLRSFGARGRDAIGKFNPGQKLNASAIVGLLSVLLLTGLVLRWGSFLAVRWRTGATFVHDWFAIALAILVVGHVAMAIAHPRALRSMVTGWVSSDWARRHAPAWLDQGSAAKGAPAPGTGVEMGQRQERLPVDHQVEREMNR